MQNAKYRMQNGEAWWVLLIRTGLRELGADGANENGVCEGKIGEMRGNIF